MAFRPTSFSLGGGWQSKGRCASQEQIRELQRLLGKKILETEVLKEALEIATESKEAARRSVIADMPPYGYARVWAILRREAIAERRPPANRKRIYRVMRAHGLLLQRHAGGREERRHDRTCTGARTASRSPATMPRKSVSPSPLIAAIERP
jgi:hypothetical protein